MQKERTILLLGRPNYRTVYAIRHKKTNRVYVGSSIRPDERYKSHLQRLRAGTHPVEDMQDDFNKYGEDYTFLILDKIETHEDRRKEYDWMRKYNSTNRACGYNYKDHEKTYSRRLSESDKRKKELKEFYTKAITKMVRQCGDIDLLDLIFQTLTKASTKE